MKEIELWSFGTRDRSGKVRWLAHELGYHIEEHRLTRGEHKAPDYLRINPFGFVPTVRLNQDKLLTESTAACLYLAERHPEYQLVPTIDHPQRADFLFWVSTFTESLEAKCVEYFLGKIGVLDDSDTAYLREPIMARLDVVLDMLPSNDTLVPGQFTVADIFASYSLRLALASELVIKEQISAYLSPLAQRPAAQKAEFFQGLI